MPLSEHEQRLLEQLEKQLHEDHRFASSMKSNTSPGGYSTRNMAIGALLAVVGIVVLILGVSSQWIPVGVVGFALMCGGVYIAVSRNALGGGSKAPKNAGAKSSFMADLESRWDARRRDDQ
ncbi:DUF3040 domain-containing protein [Zafaria sp. J156]|uniref:DUF3040 domain-containing protein n=1 Tax=Zafaria sp. J156 TaxID=3116490 RepID=UPI002E78CA34|nr:DUF3040 domain-containing protein [Zafaria sp. J156]MEE1620298.1 DUF3040 domain-containing protein [Zafaria sp. J156]